MRRQSGGGGLCRFVDCSDVMLVVWDVLSHMVCISVGHCIKVDCPDLKPCRGIASPDMLTTSQTGDLALVSSISRRARERESESPCAHLYVIILSAYFHFGFFNTLTSLGLCSPCATIKVLFITDLLFLMCFYTANWLRNTRMSQNGKYQADSKIQNRPLNRLVEL